MSPRRTIRLTPHRRAEITLERLIAALERWDGRQDVALRVAVIDRYREFREANAIAGHARRGAEKGLGGKSAYKLFTANKRRAVQAARETMGNA